MAKVEADKTLIKQETVTTSTYVPTLAYRRVPAKAEAYSDIPLVKPDENLKLEIQNALVHEAARALYASSILPQSVEVNSIMYKVNFSLIQGPKAVINISAWHQGKKVTEVSLN